MSFFKRYSVIFLCAVLSVVLVFVTDSETYASEPLTITTNIEESILPQKISRVSNQEHTVIKMYDSGKLIGVFTDFSLLDNQLKETYINEYQNQYPDSSLALSTDIYFTEETSYFYYENIDNQIMNYLNQHQLYALEVNRVEFSNGAVVYVKDLDDFESAKDKYLLNYVDSNSLTLIKQNQLPPELTTYGERVIDIQVAETYTVGRGYAIIDQIMDSEDEVLEFFCYGYGTEKEVYVTEEFDTVEGAAFHTGLSPQQLMTLNSDILKSETQLLEAGTELNATFFNSPINVIVTEERVAKEVVYAGKTIYQPNKELREGVNNVLVREKDGSKNVYYKEVYINGEMTSQEVISEEITLEPIQQVVEYGTKIIPGVGTGTFRWPVNNGKVTCHWACYNSPVYGLHTGVDIIDRSNRYGYVRAADRGTIEEVGYNGINGYYVYINHNNGYRTYYGHMKSKCYYSVGVNVEKGEIIGQIGQTGAASGPHVHFVIYTGKTKHDACKWLGC